MLTASIWQMRHDEAPSFDEAAKMLSPTAAIRDMSGFFGKAGRVGSVRAQSEIFV